MFDLTLTARVSWSLNDWAIELEIYFIISFSFSSSSDKLHADSNCCRTVFTVSNFVTDSSNLFDRVRFYPSGTIVLFLNLFVFKLVLAILLQCNQKSAIRPKYDRNVILESFICAPPSVQPMLVALIFRIASLLKLLKDSSSRLLSAGVYTKISEGSEHRFSRQLGMVPL